LDPANPPDAGGALLLPRPDHVVYDHWRSMYDVAKIFVEIKTFVSPTDRIEQPDTSL
jgi:hypothetical protein